MKDMVIGLGEIGNPIYKILSKKYLVVGYDLNTNLMDLKKFKKFEDEKTDFLHISIPFSNKFVKAVVDICKKFNPNYVVIHSTISPYTTEKIQKKLDIPIIYSATRGIHKRMEKDLKRYSKFYSVYDWAPNSKVSEKKFKQKMKQAGLKTKKMSSPLVLELSKIIVDTSYYGWLINYAQLTNMIAIENNVDYDEMWSFADEINKLVGNRPKLYPGFIGGHCVIPNLDLIDNKTLDLIKEINTKYLKIVPDAKLINKKYEKSKKQSYDI
jgi:UDP-N-acetyl-D-mannosaminuronate dehydrogenase